ncbi:P68 family surface lipoprotein [Mesomycoplasma bovoculi]|uniref:Putative lipoprotein n=1 Tax=Mesomycoplasma bovoculi M165/69 TaxID=743966 RepID=W5UTT3_9BACT|nr:P80 family lipoprotein [Mesomycoplasma bovoculi]AHH45537.1 putative lipoprotein [Mesomycoplasma bovoculi M165/69]
MFKFKNKSLKAALLAMPLASVVALASCGPIADKIGKADKTDKTESSTNFGFNQPEDGKLKFGIPWKNDARYDAMLDIAKKWNNLPTVKDQENKDFLPIEIEGYTGYYDGMASQITKDISARNAQKGLNLLFNYSGLAATLNKYDMLLNLGSNPDLKKTIENTYVSDFLKAGNLISGVDPKGIYLIPAVKSGKTLGIDIPLLAYFVDQATKDGSATIKPEDKAFFDGLKKTDQEFIAKTWGSYTKIPLNNGGLEGYQFSKSKLENYKDLFDLASRIKKSFPSSNNDDGISSKGRWLVGVNDSASHWFISSFQVGNSDFKNYIVDFGPNVKSFDYRVTKKGTPAYENGKQAFDLFENLQKDDAVIYEGNAPKNDSLFEVSTIQKKHLLPFALMSTTSYNKKYEEKESDEKMNADELMLLPEPTKTFETETKKSITSQGPSIMAMHANAQEDKATENFLKWFISEQNTFEYKDKSKATQTFTGTANDYFAFRSNYLNPTKSNLTSDYKSNDKLPHNPMFELLFNTFKTVVNDNNEYSVYSEPGDATSQAFRKAVQTAFGSIGNQLKSNNNDTSKINFDTFLSELKKSSNRIIK